LYAADVGQRAVQALEELAPKDDQAMARLVGALEEKVPEVRRAALASLEKVQGADSPQPSLIALATPHADLRRLALVRLFQRKLLHNPRVQAALRWRGEDQDPEVRRVAFLLSLYTREKLLGALRSRDAELDRQLTELELGTLPALAAPEEKVAPPEGSSAPPPGAPAATSSEADRQAVLRMIAGQIEAVARREQALAPPEQPAAPPGGAPAVVGAEAMLARLEELSRQGLVPAPMIQHLQRTLQRLGPDQCQAFLSSFAAQVEAMARRGKKPEEP
jgi:hypothetical protein